MANQSSARLRGDDYQHLYTWFVILDLLRPSEQVNQVNVEDPQAGSVDDVTVFYEPTADEPNKFYQIKYHVDQRGVYSTASFIEQKKGSTSLLKKFWTTWKQLLNQNSQQPIQLYLISNWTWDSRDSLKDCLSGHDNSFTSSFFESTKSSIRQARQKWQNHLDVDDDEFTRFISCLRLRLGYHSTEDLEKLTKERMQSLGLKSDEAALKTAVGIVREHITRKKISLNAQALEVKLQDNNLYKPLPEEQYVTVHLLATKNSCADSKPDYIINWFKYFEGADIKGHQLINPTEWNTVLLPELRSKEQLIKKATTCRLIKAHGSARLSAWFAFGFIFSKVAGYTLEIKQNENPWRTDTQKNPDFSMNKGCIPPYIKDILHVNSSCVAVGISITGSIKNAVCTYLQQSSENIANLLLLQPNRELGEDCFKTAGDVVAFADSTKKYIHDFVEQHCATKVLLFYYGPLSGACFLGHKLNAVCREVQIMEHQNPGYAPSFILK